jgi:TonB family protein
MRACAAVAVFFLCSFLLSAGATAGRDDAPSSEILLSRARTLQDFRMPGVPPILIRADIDLPQKKGEILRGNYTVYWMSPTRWREEIRFADFYERIRVGDEKGYWQRRSTPYEPEVMFQLEKMLDLRSVLGILPNQTLGKAWNRRKEGIEQRCTDVKWLDSVGETLCFSAADGLLSSVDYSGFIDRESSHISRIEYGTFVPVGDKWLAKQIRSLSGGKLFAQMNVAEAKTMEPQDPALFDRPVMSDFWQACEDPRPAELLKRVEPVYPEGARRLGQSGQVDVFAIIETDGALSHLQVIELKGPTPTFAEAAVQALRQWRYKPSTCGDAPRRVETHVTVNFGVAGPW